MVDEISDEKSEPSANNGEGQSVITENIEELPQPEVINLEQLQMCFANVPSDYGMIIYELAMTRYRLVQQMQINKNLEEKIKE